MKKRKVVLLCFVAGRVGSSLTMGLLQQSGIDVGKVDPAKVPQNPKGFFEILSYEAYIKQLFPSLNGFMPGSMPREQVQQICIKNGQELQAKLDGWFTGDFIAIKCPYYLGWGLFDGLDVVTIGLSRNIKSQAASCQRWNTREGDFETWLKKWYKYVANYQVDLNIEFDEWFTAPYDTYLKLTTVVQPPVILSKQQVESWIEKRYKRY